MSAPKFVIFVAGPCLEKDAYILTHNMKIIDLLRLVLKIAGYNPEIKILPAPEGCVMRRCPDTRKLYSLTGFKAEITPEEALPEMYRWYEERYKERELS